jgi:hypothetical protein
MVRRVEEILRMGDACMKTEDRVEVVSQGYWLVVTVDGEEKERFHQVSNDYACSQASACARDWRKKIQGEEIPRGMEWWNR